MNNYQIEKVVDSEELSKRASQIIASNIQFSLDQKDSSQIALSGGSTPSRTYLLLGQKNLAWEKVDVFLGDERWVDPTDENSNSLMVKNTLLSHSPGSKSKFHTVSPFNFKSADAGATALTKLLQSKCSGNPPVLDLVILGLGDDGHTASLFPGTNSLTVKDQLVTVSSGKGHDRITFTQTILSAARKVLFLVSGNSKCIALKRLIDPLEDWQRTPAKLIQPKSNILILADADACYLI